MEALGRNVILGMTVPEKEGKIVLPQKHQKSTNRCEVRHIGPQVKRVSVGDIVLKPELLIVSQRRDENFDVMDGDVPCMVVMENDIRVVLERAADAASD